MPTKRLRSWFFQPTSVPRLDGTTGGVRFRTNDEPTQSTLEDLTASAAFFTESNSKANVSSNSAIENEQGLVVLANDTQARSNSSQPSDRSIVVQPSQLPTVEQINITGIQDMPDSQLQIGTSGLTSTRNRYIVGMNTSWINWLISRIFKQGGVSGDVPIKNSSTNYDWSYGNVGNNPATISALLANTTFINNLTTTIINNNPSAISDALPVGTTLDWLVTTMPSSKWLRMDGSAISRTTYSDLFTLLGTTYGVGDGSTTFNLPDFRDRQSTGYSGTKSIASSGGADSQVIGTTNLPPHTHDVGSISVGNHTHTIGYNNLPLLDGGSGSLVHVMSQTDGVLASYNTGLAGAGSASGNTGDGGFANTALSTMDKYLAINKIVKVLP